MQFVIEKNGKPCVVNCSGQRDEHGFCPIIGCKFWHSAKNHWSYVNCKGRLIHEVVKVTVNCFPDHQLLLF